MTTAEKILHYLAILSEHEQNEVLKFIEQLEIQSRDRRQHEETQAWTAFSLENAMQGLENDAVEYTRLDLKETF